MLFLQVFEYVTQTPSFWPAMGWVTACAMFLGATIYNGDTTKLCKWLITTIPYTLLMIAVNILRLHNVDINDHVQAYAGSFSILVTSFFYFLGMIMGVGLIHIFVRKNDE